MDCLRIAVVGAESTGKTTLARAMAQRIGVETGLTCTWVAEWLRDWCDAQGRTPRRDEQAAIAAQQQARIDAAAAAHQVVVCDTTPLMTAVYSQFLFGDTALLAQALQWQRGHALTLLTALDLPWVADAHQRDGPQVREPVDRLLRQHMMANALPFSVIAHQGPTRLQAAVDAVTPLLRTRQAHVSGLFTRLTNPEAQASPRPWQPQCDCDSPACEHASLIRPPAPG